MNKVRPRPVVGKKDAKRLGISPLTGAARPPFQFDHAAIYRSCRLAGLTKGDAEKMARVARSLTSEYLIERRTDGQSVTATEARDLARRLDSAASTIRDVLSRRFVSRFLAADIEDSLSHVEGAAGELRCEAGEPMRGGGMKAKADAKLGLAVGLMRAFEANKWDMRTGPKSLMAEALRICLQAGGTPHTRADRILAAAKKQLLD